jgi:preprotein translocase subunit SecA
MLSALTRLIVGSSNARTLKRYERKVAVINGLEPQFAKLNDVELKGKTAEFRDRLAKGATLDDLLPEAFATVREAAKRTLGQRHFDVQLMGGMALHDKSIAEMKTGEGKTLVSTLAAYLNALPGKGVHIVTVNDYLARRDAAWMGQIYNFLGLTVGVVVHGIMDGERKAAYGCDITYGTNNELGFDYLRDNMKYSLQEMVQRPFWFAIVDEVDSILIDEARTPLIISGPSTDSSELYTKIDVLMRDLPPEDYEKDEKMKTVTLTELGTERMEERLKASGLMEAGSLYDVNNIQLVHHVNAALKAHKLFTHNVDYIVKDNKVIIIDEFTGRMMEGRRYSDGLHQALEAKEKVAIQRENQTLASITFQNYFRLYPKLAGMTGTAMTEKQEFGEIYGLDVLSIPTNVPVARKDHDDVIYVGQKDKYAAIIELIKECNERQQPVLVGTTSIEKSELLSHALKRAGIAHNVLNAKYHETEAEIVAQAGRPGAVTIATNMAGRGTDIQLGGNLDMRIKSELKDMPEGPAREAAIAKIKDEIAKARDIVRNAGGLFVIGTERHESRRIDNQLRGRSGRQGDPGASEFFLALDDDLMRIFGTDRMKGMLVGMGMKEGEPVYDRWISKALEKAQQKVEERNFDIRKNLLKFDNVMNDQRKVIYEQRRELMEATDVNEITDDMRDEIINNLVTLYIPEGSYSEHWQIDSLHAEVNRLMGLNLPIKDWAAEDGMAEMEIFHRIRTAAAEKYAAKVAQNSPDLMRLAEKSVLLQLLDQNWKEHLLRLDHLRQGIGLRGIGQRDPLNEYKREAFEMFGAMMGQLREQVTSTLMKIEIRVSSPEGLMPRRSPQEMREVRPEAEPAFADGPPPGEPLPEGMQMAGNRRAALQPLRKAALDLTKPETWVDTPRNNPCPCGSGKKYKHCHGK